MTNINKVMNLAIYHPSERVRKKNEARFFRDILNIKDDYELGKIAYSFFEKVYDYKNHDIHTIIPEYRPRFSYYIYKQRKSYLRLPDSKKIRILNAMLKYNECRYQYKIYKYTDYIKQKGETE